MKYTIKEARELNDWFENVFMIRHMMGDEHYRTIPPREISQLRDLAKQHKAALDRLERYEDEVNNEAQRHQRKVEILAESLTAPLKVEE